MPEVPIDDPLVIHGGQLMPAAKAWVEMMQEFPPHGYTEPLMRNILDRAVAATQNLLHEISGLSEGDARIRLEWALRADAQAARRWRSQWAIGSQRYEQEQYQSNETHEERMSRYRRDKELQDAGQRAWELQAPERQRLAQERRERYRKEQEEQRELRKKALLTQSKNKYQQQYEVWIERNEAGSWKDQARERGLQRQQEDAERKRWRQHLRIEASHLLTEARLNRLSDAEYIEWKFECHRHELVAPI